MKFKRFLLPVSIWVCAALFYLYQFILRVSPSVMLNELMASFQISAAEVGALSAAAMYTYSALQIPSGFLSDWFGVRRVILVSLVCCILGTIIFVSSEQLIYAKLGRCLLGAGSAAAFLSVAKVSAEWFAPEKRGTLLGLTMAVGTLGALNGSAPLAALVARVGWRQSLLWTTALGGVIFLLNFLFLKDRHSIDSSEQEGFQVPSEKKSVREFFSQVKATLKTPVCWLSAFTALGIYLAISVIADLWGVTFLVQVHSLSKETASQVTSLIYVGLCVGSLLLAIVSDSLHRRKEIMSLCLFLLLVSLLVVVYTPQLPLFGVSVGFFLIGFFAGAEMLCFAHAHESADRSISGTITGFMNGFVMLGGAILQQQVGKILDQYWSGMVQEDGVRIYSLAEFQMALGLVAVIVFLSWLAALFLPKQIQARSA